MHSTSTRSNSLRLGLAYAELLNSHQRLHTIPVLITMENTKLNIIPSFISFFSFQKEERSNWNYIKLRSPMPSISYWDIYFGTIKNVFHALILFWILKQFMIYKNFEIEMLKSRFSGLLGLSASTKMYKRNPPKKTPQTIQFNIQIYKMVFASKQITIISFIKPFFPFIIS